MKNSRLKRILSIYIILLFLGTGIKPVQAQEEAKTIQKFEFTESIEEFNNPDMGIYRPTFIRCKPEGEWANTKIQYANGLVHLRIGIKDFSKAGNGVQDYAITSEHIEKLNQYMRTNKRSGRNGNYKICL